MCQMPRSGTPHSVRPSQKTGSGDKFIFVRIGKTADSHTGNKMKKCAYQHYSV